MMLEKRVEIYRLHADGKSRRAIGPDRGRSAATIPREQRRNSPARTYAPDPERIDWNDYWINNQVAGTEKWIQPEAVKDWAFKI